MNNYFEKRSYTLLTDPSVSPVSEGEVVEKEDVEVRGYRARRIKKARPGSISRIALAVTLSKEDLGGSQLVENVTRNFQPYPISPDAVVNEGPVREPINPSYQSSSIDPTHEIRRDQKKALDTMEAFAEAEGMQDRYSEIVDKLIENRGFIAGKMFVLIEQDPHQEKSEDEFYLSREKIGEGDEDYELGRSLAEEMFINRPDLLPVKEDLRMLSEHQIANIETDSIQPLERDSLSMYQKVELPQGEQVVVKCVVISFKGRQVIEKIGRLTVNRRVE